MLIQTIATVIFIHLALFLITLLLGICACLKKYCAGLCKKKPVEGVFYDPYIDLSNISIDRYSKTPIPTPTPPKTPTPEPTPPRTPTPPPKEKTPSLSSDTEPEMEIKASDVLVKKNANGEIADENEETMAATMKEDFKLKIN